MYVKVIVNAGAKKEVVNRLSENRFKVSVKEKAKQNQANRRVIEIMAGRFSVLPKQVKIISGHHHPAKLLKIGD